MLEDELKLLHSRKLVVRVIAGPVDVTGYISDWDDTHLRIKTVSGSIDDMSGRPRESGIKTLIKIDKIDGISSTYTSFV